MHQVMVETDRAMDTADHIEEREAVASFYRLMEQIEESMPDDMKERSAHEFLSPDELLAKQSAE